MLLLVALLALSNFFMTAAWFMHLRAPEWPMWKAILISWLIAGIEYAIAIPAVRYAHDRGITPATIKVTQEAVTFIVFGLAAGLLLTQTGVDGKFGIAAILIVSAVLVVSRG